MGSKLYHCPNCTSSHPSLCKARSAIKIAVENGDSIHDLEFVGVNHRTLSTLDDSGVIFLEQLLQLTQEEVLKIDSIGVTSLQQIMQGLCEFHLVKPIRCKHERELYRNVARLRKEIFEVRKFQYEPDDDWENEESEPEFELELAI